MRAMPHSIMEQNARNWRQSGRWRQLAVGMPSGGKAAAAVPSANSARCQVVRSRYQVQSKYQVPDLDNKKERKQTPGATTNLQGCHRFQDATNRSVTGQDQELEGQYIRRLTSLKSQRIDGSWSILDSLLP